MNMMCSRRIGCVAPAIVFLSLLAVHSASAQPAAPVPRERILPDLVARADATRAKLAKPKAVYGCRELFTSMLAYAETHTNATRIAELLTFAEAMQDTDAKHRSFGNFRWYSRDSAVQDYNAVDFCMQHGALLWRFHRDELDPAVRERLHAVLTRGLRGLIKHRPPTTYTNIALLNASDLVLLGETLGDAQAAAEGERRLVLFAETLWEEGLHEYDSPTYYGVDIESLLLLESLAEKESARSLARTLLEYVWTDLAFNWFAPGQRLGGAHSRTYDYVFGFGELDQILTAVGWLPPERRFAFSTFIPLYTRWHPPAELWTLCAAQYPRLVEQTWGADTFRYRTHYVCPDVTLSTAGQAYIGRMDAALAADFPGTRDQRLPRLSFVPDGRSDPYGKKPVFDGKTHSKAFHLSPWWAGVQDKADALSVAVYRDTDFKDAAGSLESHLLFRKRLDGLWINETRVDFAPRPPSMLAVPPGAAVFLRQGSAAIGIRIPWSRGQDGSASPASLVDDGNAYGAVRLTVSHAWLAPSNGLPRIQAGVAFWLRVGSGLDTDDAFAAFRHTFAAADAHADADSTSLCVRVQGLGHPLSVAARAPFTADPEVSPAPPRLTLGLNGEAIGRPLLEKSPVIQAYLRTRRAGATVHVAADRATEWEAENAGFTVPYEAATNDAAASGHAYLWVPEVDGQSSGGSGRATYTLDVAQAGRYALSGRVLTPTPDDDSFFLSLRTPDGRVIVPETAWSPGVHTAWTWRVFSPAPIDLPAGPVLLILRPREAGSKIDAFRLVPIP